VTGRDAARGLLTAVRYLTVLPLPKSAAAGDLGAAAAWFPVIGLAVGLALAGAAWLLDLALPPALVAVLLVALWAALTGGLHLDGLGDALDGLGGAWERSRALAIMRDGALGAYGVAGIVLVLAVKIAALATFSADSLWRALILAPTLGRLGPLLLAAWCPAARAEGAGHAFVAGLRPLAVGLGAVVAGLVGLGLAGEWGLAALAAVALAAGLAALYLRRRLDGLTGDCLGAQVELTEALVLVLLAGLDQLELLPEGWLFTLFRSLEPHLEL
jgi:adenosylcobinamide-GDP ribazoletransferase